MSTRALIHRQFRALTELWPADPLRPNLSLQALLQKRVERQFVQALVAEEDLPTDLWEGRPVVKYDEAQASREVNVLGSLLEDRYRKKYPVSDRILKPRGNPGYYDNLVKELEEAPRRSWWQTKLNSWKGYVRMK